MIVTGNAQLLKSINRVRVINHIRSRPGISRATLADELGLSRSSIGHIVEELIRDDWLGEGAAVVTGNSGRRATPLTLNSSRKVVLGANIDGATSEVLALSLGGETRELTFVSASGSPEGVLDVLASQIAELHRKLSDMRYQIAAIGVAVPGPVRPDQGILHHSDFAGWKEVPIRDMLQPKLRALGVPDVPLVLQRAIACLAVRVVEFEHLQEEQPIVYVHVGRTIGVVGISGSEVVRGYQGVAGSIAHLNIEPDGPLCECGLRGCANAVLTLRAAETELNIDGANLRLRARRRDPDIQAVMHRVGEKLGTFLFNLVCLYDPARLLVSGPAFQLGREYACAAQERLDLLARAAGVRAPALQVTRHERQSFAIGAGTLALHKVLQELSEH